MFFCSSWNSYRYFEFKIRNKGIKRKIQQIKVLVFSFTLNYEFFFTILFLIKFLLYSTWSFLSSIHEPCLYYWQNSLFAIAVQFRDRISTFLPSCYFQIFLRLLFSHFIVEGKLIPLLNHRPFGDLNSFFCLTYRLNLLMFLAVTSIVFPSADQFQTHSTHHRSRFMNYLKTIVLRCSAFKSTVLQSTPNAKWASHLDAY